MAPRRRRQFYALVALMLVGSLSELLTIGAVIPFLALMSAPERATEVPGMTWFLQLMDWRPDANLLIPATILLVAVAVITGVIRLVLNWACNKFVFRLGHDIGMRIYSRILRQPYGFYVKRNTSEVLSGIEKIQVVIFSVLQPMIQGFVAAIMSLFIALLLFAINPMTAAIAAVTMVVVYVGVSIVTRKLLRHNSGVIASMQTQRIQQIQEGLGGIRDILIDQSQPVFEENFRRLDSELRNAQAVNVFVSVAPRFIVESAGIVMIALLALYMSFQPGGVVAAIPILGALALGAQRLLPLLQIVYSAWSSLAGAFQLVFDVVSLMYAPVISATPRDRSRPPEPFKQGLVFAGVTFHYEASDAPALSEVNLRIDKGERVGFLGKTGSGKSTLLDLTMGLLPPTRGEIRIDGVPLDAGSIASWQGQIAHVPQFIYLSDSSIASNIAFGERAEDIDMDRVRDAAASSQIDSFIRSLPEGYETAVGERGVRLSGGQRQRIGIARALYKRASVLILDEATSALDDDTEAAVIGSLSAMGRELTILMIAHRLSTLAGCDKLVRLEGGRVVEVGNFNDVVGAAASATSLQR